MVIRLIVLVIATAAAATQAMPTDAPGSAAPSPAAAAPLPQGDGDTGQGLYAENCRACHSGAIAPSLKGVVGRPIASVAGYAYSDGLKAKAATTWTPDALSAFLADPEAFAPGTKMKKKVPDAQERADMVAYLQSLGE